MEMRDTMRDPEFWAYVRAHAADPTDTNITGKFADWLQDREHESHAVLVRNHREPDEFGYTEHPEGQSGRLVFPFSAGRERALHAWQTADPGEGVHVLRTGLHNAPYRQLPVLRWNIPIKDSKWDESQHVTFQAPLTAEQHREFLRHMPAGAIKNQWVRHAHTMGWLEKKEKLARSDMDETEYAFVRHLEAEPQDRSARLMYADWLQEQDRPVAEHAHRAAAAHDFKPLVKRTIVTLPRGSWRWQDAYTVQMYRPEMLKNGQWVWKAQGSGVGKSSMPRLRRLGFGSLSRGSLHNTRLIETGDKVTAAHVAYHEPRALAEGKTRLARTQPHDSLATAVAESGGEKQKQLADLARQIFKEAGLSPASVRQVYTNEGAKGIRSSLVSIISKHVHPARTRYAAAWYGLLSGEPKLTVFHPHDKGEDTLHIITSPVPNDVMSGYLQRSGLKSYSTEDTPVSGSRAYIYTPAGSELPAGLPEGLHASHTALRGFGYKLGSGTGSDADARANYRDTIRQYEATANGGSETPPARVHPARLSLAHEVTSWNWKHPQAAERIVDPLNDASDPREELVRAGEHEGYERAKKVARVSDQIPYGRAELPEGQGGLSIFRYRYRGHDRGTLVRWYPKESEGHMFAKFFTPDEFEAWRQKWPEEHAELIRHAHERGGVHYAAGS